MSGPYDIGAVYYIPSSYAGDPACVFTIVGPPRYVSSNVKGRAYVGVPAVVASDDGTSYVDYWSVMYIKAYHTHWTRVI